MNITDTIIGTVNRITKKTIANLKVCLDIHRFSCSVVTDVLSATSVRKLKLQKMIKKKIIQHHVVWVTSGCMGNISI